MSRPSNVWVELGVVDDDEGVRGERLLERAPEERLRAAVWELDPGKASGQYHIHHATEELLIVLRGRPTIRTPVGERQLEEGDVVHFPTGPAGAHQVVNRSGDVVRFLMTASHSVDRLDVIEYLDDSQVVVWTAVESPQQGRPLFFVHELDR